MLTNDQLDARVKTAAIREDPNQSHDPIVRFAGLLANRYQDVLTRAGSNRHRHIERRGELRGLALGFMVAAGATDVYDIGTDAVMIHLRGTFEDFEPYKHTEAYSHRDFSVARIHELAHRLRSIAACYPGGLS
jgi:hypothetical protein